MRKLIDGQNVDGASADYPKGKTRDKVGSTPGTILNELLRGDMEQFFQKLIIDAGITENDLPDNVTNGYQLLDALISKIDSLNGGLRTTVFEIGDWNMDTIPSVIIPINNIAFNKIINFSVIILSDPNFIGNITVKNNLLEGGGHDLQYDSGLDEVSALLNRTNGGQFDSINHDSTSYNRGWIIIEHQA